MLIVCFINIYNPQVNAYTTGTFGNTAQSGSTYSGISANEAAGGNFTSPATKGQVVSIVFYGATSSSTHNVKCIITFANGTILTNGISPAVSTSTSASWRTATFATPPVYSANTYYVIAIIPDTTSFRLYYSATTGGLQEAYTGDSYSSPTTATWTHTNATLYSIYANININSAVVEPTVTQSLSPKTSASRMDAPMRSASQSISSLLSVTRVFGAVRSSSQSASLTLSANRLFSGVRVSSESVSVLLSVSRLFTGSRPTTQPISTLLSVSRLFSGVRFSSQSVSATTSGSRSVSNVASANSLVSLFSSTSRIFSGSRSSNQSASLLLSVSRLFSGVRSGSQSISTSSSTIRSVGNIFLVTTLLNNLLLSTNRVFSGVRSSSQSVSISLSVSRLFSGSRSSSLSVSTLLSGNRVFSAVRSSSQSTSLMLSVSRLFTGYRSTSQTASTTTSSSRSVGNVVSVNSLTSMLTSAARIFSGFRASAQSASLISLSSRSVGNVISSNSLISMLSSASRIFSGYRSSNQNVAISSSASRVAAYFRSIETNILSLFSVSSTVLAPPSFSSMTSTTSYAGVAAQISVTITDNLGVSSWRCASNNTGSMVNGTVILVSGSPVTALYNDTLENTVGDTVVFQFWANDTSNNAAYSSVGYLTLTKQLTLTSERGTQLSPTPSPSSGSGNNGGNNGLIIIAPPSPSASMVLDLIPQSTLVDIEFWLHPSIPVLVINKGTTAGDVVINYFIGNGSYLSQETVFISGMDQKIISLPLPQLAAGHYVLNVTTSGLQDATALIPFTVETNRLFILYSIITIVSIVLLVAVVIELNKKHIIRL